MPFLFPIHEMPKIGLIRTGGAKVVEVQPNEALDERKYERELPTR